MSQIPKILQDMYLKNLKFFEKQNSQIHQVLSSTAPDHSNIIINENGLIDLNYKGKNIYNGDAIKYSEEEVAEFNSIHLGDKRMTPISAPRPNSYTAERFFHRHLNSTISKIHDKTSFKTLNCMYTENRHDFLIIAGIGLGLHITELLEKTEVQNLVILETDFELLTLSCFFTDWENLYDIQSPKKSKSITFLLLNEQEIVNEQGMLWNQLIKRAPHFPYNTIFYNHGRHNKYGKIIRKMQQDTPMYLNLWGFYDDETNQLNHILHNINNKIRLIPTRNSFMWSKQVIVCGSGPSLDTRINQLKEIRDDCILISAGTSLLALLKYDLTPDFHVELESDYNVYTLLENLPIEKLKKINLICALQCSPYITTLFKDSYAFIKDSMAIGDIIEDRENKLLDCTPTCVNAALSIALHYSAEKIYLFGTDFGFYDKKNHHSKNSIYNATEIKTTEIDSLKKETNDFMEETIAKEGYSGTCLTTGVYFTTKRRIEMLIGTYNTVKHQNIFNVSDGLIINYTTHIKSDEKILTINSEVDDVFEFKQQSRSLNKNSIDKITNTIHPVMKELCDLLKSNLFNLQTNTKDLSALTWAISNYIDTTFKDKHGSLVYFIRGTLWHYMVSGYSLAYASEESDRSLTIEIWRDRFIDFLNKLPENLLSTLKKDRKSIFEDPQLTTTIKDRID